MVRAVVFVFIRIVAAVVISITRPHTTDAFTVTAEEFARVTSDVLSDAHTTLINKFSIFIAPTFNRVVGRRMATLGTTTIAKFTQV